MPKRRVLAYSLDPNQSGDQFLFNLLIAPGRDRRQPGRVAARRRSCAGDRPAPQPRAGDDPDRGRARSYRHFTDSLDQFGLTGRCRLGEFLGSCSFAGFLVSIEVFREIRIPFTSVRLGGARHESGLSRRRRGRDHPGAIGQRRRPGADGRRPARRAGDRVPARHAAQSRGLGAPARRARRRVPGDRPGPAGHGDAGGGAVQPGRVRWRSSPPGSAIRRPGGRADRRRPVARRLRGDDPGRPAIRSSCAAW